MDFNAVLKLRVQEGCANLINVGMVSMPADPVGVSLFSDGYDPLSFIKGLSEREALVLHVEVKALKDRFGLKDTAHRLYMAEVA